MKLTKQDKVFIFLLLAISVAVYHSWFSFDVLSTGDYYFIFNETLRDNALLSVWVQHVSLGSVDSMLWRPTYSFVLGSIGWLTGADMNIADRLVILWPWVILSTLPAYFLVRKVTASSVGGFIGALVFGFNTYFLAINTQGHILLSIAGALGVLALLFFMEALEQQKPRYAVLAVLFLALTGFYDLRFLYMTLAVLCAYFFYHGFFIRRPQQLQRGKKHRGKKTVFRSARLYRIRQRIALIPFSQWKLLFAVGFLLAMIEVFWVVILTLFGSTGTIINRTLFGSQFWNLMDSFTLHHPFWTGGKLEWFVNSPAPAYFLLIPILAFIGLCLQRKNRVVMFFGCVALVGVLLCKQADVPFSGLYQWAYGHVPGFAAFREATKFYFFIALGYAVLIGSLVDWAWRRWDGGIIAKSAKYTLFAALSLLFLVNAIPLATGEIGSMFTSKQVPRDYIRLNDYISKQPDSFRTLWVPQRSRWAANTNAHPTTAIADLAEIGAGQYFEDIHASIRSERDRPIATLKQNFSEQLLRDMNVKYVIVPLRDIANDNDLYKYYGGSQRFFANELNKIDYLQAVDIGTKEVLVYENKRYKASITARSNVSSIPDFHITSDLSRFSDAIGQEEPGYFSPTATAPSLDVPELRSLFESPVFQSSGITDTVTTKQQSKAKLYKNVSSATLMYKATDRRIWFFSRPNADIALDGRTIHFASTADIQLDEIALQPDQHYFIEEDGVAMPVRPGESRALGSMIGRQKIQVLTDRENLIQNPSFEEGTWQNSVSDCNRYDGQPNIGMQLDSDHNTDGARSLQLEATRHIACVSTKIDITSYGKHVFSFDYQGQDAQRAGYYLQFNDKKQTAYSDKPGIPQHDKWQAFARTIQIPKDATSATLTVYAYESDGRTANTVRYDDFRLSKPETLKTIALPDVKDEYKEVALTLPKGKRSFSLSSETSATNLIYNPSFEKGPWGKKVGDCNHYDEAPAIAMRLDSNHKTDGARSLQLEATRHNACVSTEINIPTAGDFMLRFDVQSSGAKYAGYNLQFDDAKSTKLSELISIKKRNKWQQFNKKVVVPPDATKATLTIYAYESNGVATNAVRYDNFTFIDVPDLDNTYFLATNYDRTFEAPSQISYASPNPTKKHISVQKASKPFVLGFADSFHREWKLYLRPTYDKVSCKTTKILKASPGSGEASVRQCQSSQRPVGLQEISLLRQTPLFDKQHFSLNGYANGWIVDPTYITKHYGSQYYTKNSDGTISFELVAYFRPQSYFVIGLFVSVSAFVACVLYLIIAAVKRKRGQQHVYRLWPVKNRTDVS